MLYTWCSGATKQTPMLSAARHTTSQWRRTTALRASVRTKQSGILIPASMISFAPLPDTSAITHVAIIDPWSSWISPVQRTSWRRERLFSPPDRGRANLKADEFTDLLSLTACNLLSLYQMTTPSDVNGRLTPAEPQESP
jgi:hypothetical protein